MRMGKTASIVRVIRPSQAKAIIMVRAWHAGKGEVESFALLVRGELCVEGNNVDRTRRVQRKRLEARFCRIGTRGGLAR